MSHENQHQLKGSMNKLRENISIFLLNIFFTFSSEPVSLLLLDVKDAPLMV